MNNDLDGLLEFLLYVGQAKQTFRTGWIVHGVEKIDNVADHMYRMAVMSLLLPTISEESKVRCMKIALVHDLSESVIGDLIELESVPIADKRRRETEAMLYLTCLLPADIGREIFSLFNEYADQKTHESKLVKDLDIFDMLLQACEYEKLESEDEVLEDLFAAAEHNVRTVIVRRWLHQLTECRSSGKQFQLPSDSNINTLFKPVGYKEGGAFLYNILSPERRSKSDRLVFNNIKSDHSGVSSLDTTQLLTNIVKDMKHHN